MATSTKKILEDDFTKQQQAQTAADVNAQDSRTRLWQSLDYSYGRQREDTGKNYDKAIGQADRAAQARGMGRSSYNLQNMANLGSEKAKALGDIDAAQIADYQNRITQLEQQEADRGLQERQFQENVRQFNESQNLTRSENALNRAFQTSEREATQGYNTSEREASQKYQTGEREATQLYNTGEREAQQGWQSGENALNRQHETSEREASQTWQSGENQLNRDLTASESQKQIALAIVQAAAQNGGTVSKALLKSLGISDKDYKAMLKKARSGGGGNGNGGGTGNVGLGAGVGNVGSSIAESLLQSLLNT